MNFGGSTKSVKPPRVPIILLILFLSFLVLSDHQGLELLLDRPYWLLNFALLHSFGSGEVRSRMENLSFEAWAAFVYTGSESQ